MTWMLKLIASLALVTGATAAYADRVTYKGVALGAERRTVLNALPDMRCNSERLCTYSPSNCPRSPIGGGVDAVIENAKACDQRNSFAGARVNGALAVFRDGRLARITLDISSTRMDEVIDALTQRLGDPSSVSQEPVTTRAGVVVPNIEAEWRQSGDVTRATKHSGQVGAGVVVMTTTQSLEQDAAEATVRASKAAKDF